MGIFDRSRVRYFWLVIVTFTFVCGGSAMFYFVERGVNPRIGDYADALRWMLTTIPFIGGVGDEPVTRAGFAIGIVVHVIGLVLFCTWVAILGLAIFDRKKA